MGCRFGVRVGGRGDWSQEPSSRRLAEHQRILPRRGECSYPFRHIPSRRVSRENHIVSTLVEANGFSRKMGFEPGTHGRAERVDNLKSEAWMSEFPNVDIRHGDNLTPSRWRQDQFRNQRSCRGWKEAESVPGWGKTKGCFGDFLRREITAISKE